MMLRFVSKIVSKGMFIVAALIVMSTLSFNVAYAHTASIGTSIAGPSIKENCYGGPGSPVTFIAYIDANRYIHMHDVTNNRDYQSNQTSPTTPALACNDNQYPELAWKANDSTNKIWLGYLACAFSGPCSFALENISPLNATTDAAPSLIGVRGTTLYLGWVGTDAAHHLNLAASYDGGATWLNTQKRTLTDYTRSGGGLSMTYNYESGLVWVSWLASSGTPYIYIGEFNPYGLDSNQLRDYGPVADYSTNAPSMDAFGAFDTETVMFIWKGFGSNTIYTGLWTPNGGWLGTRAQSDTTNFPPVMDGYDHETAFTGTNTVVYYDVAAYHYF